MRLKTKSNCQAVNRRTGRPYLAKEYAEHEKAIAMIARLACSDLVKTPIKLGWVVITPSYKNKSHPDLSNLPKSLMDGLVKSGILEDDRYIAVTVTPASYGEDKCDVEIYG